MLRVICKNCGTVTEYPGDDNEIVLKYCRNCLLDRLLDELKL